MGEDPKTQKIKLFYLGSGGIGVRVLSRLATSPNIEITGCGTQPDRKQGRSRKITSTPIGQWCKENDFRCEKPISVNQKDFLRQLELLDLDIIVVFSYGQLLREPLLNLPKFGCLNIHTSILPKYRGASPICATILAGDPTAGVSFIKMDKGLDSGPVFNSFKISIPPNINALDLSDKLSALASDVVYDVILDVVRGGLKPQPQSNEGISFAKKIKKEDGLICWNNEAFLIERQVRAFYPWPGAWFFLTFKNKKRKITITAASVEKMEGCGEPGTIITFGKGKWGIVSGKHILVIHKLIPEGKKEMTAEDFLLGNPLETGSKI